MKKMSLLLISFYVLFFVLNVTLRAQINPNGGFENGEPGEHTGTEVPGWDFQMGGTSDAVFEVVADSELVHSGTQALMVTVNTIGANKWEPQVINQDYPVTSNTTYSLSVWAKTDVEGAKASFSMGSLAPNYNEWGRVDQAVLTTEWQQFTWEVTTRNPESEPIAGVPIHFGEVDNGALVPITFYIDDVVVTVKGTLNPNGGFEDAAVGEHTGTEVPGWDFQMGGTSDAVFEVVADSELVHSGTQALMVTVNTIGANKWEPQVINQDYPVTSNTTYSLSVWAKTDVEGAKASFSMGSLAPNYNEWGRVDQAVLTTEWQQFTWEVTTRNPESEPIAGVPIHFGEVDNGALVPITFYIDDVVVTADTGTVGVDDDVNVVNKYSLAQNYPNPFNPTTTINFTLPENSNIRLLLYDVLGNLVEEIASGNYNPGDYKVRFDASNLASGVYFYKLETNKFVSVKKLMLMK